MSVRRGLSVTVLLVGVVSCAAADPAGHIARGISDGSPWALAGTTGGLILLGGKHERQVGKRMADAGLAAAASAELLKLTIHQDRPNDPNAKDGFPSMHAAVAWSLAEAATMESPKARPYAYAVAAAVTWSRIQTKDHTVIQALSGAALGWALGHISGNTRGGIFHGLIVKGPARSKEGDRSAVVPTPGGPSLVVWQRQW